MQTEIPATLGAAFVTRFLRICRHCLTAIVLLAVFVMGLEVYLRSDRPTQATTVTPVVPAEWQTTLVPSSTTHHELRRLSEHTINGVDVKINSLGMRGPLPGQPASMRILMLGDETIFGVGLKQEETVPARLQQFLNKAGIEAEVINGGVPGDCPMLSLMRWQRDWKSLDPDVVILHFDMSDVADDTTYRRYLRREADQMICENPLFAAPPPKSPFVTAVTSSAIFEAWNGSSKTFADSLEIDRQHKWTVATTSELKPLIRHSLEPIAQAKALTTNRIAISSSPVPWQVANAEQLPQLSAANSTSASWPIEGDVPQKLLSAATRNAELPFHDTSAAFRSFSDPSKLFEPGTRHLSRYGAAIYAKELAAQLGQEQIARMGLQTRQKL